MSREKGHCPYLSNDASSILTVTMLLGVGALCVIKVSKYLKRTLSTKLGSATLTASTKNNVNNAVHGLNKSFLNI